MSDNISSLDAAIAQVDSTFQSTDKIRDGLISKLSRVVNEQLQILPEEDHPKLLDSKMNIINTLKELLKDKENSVVVAAKVKMQKKDTESSDAARQMAIELLKSINVKAAAAPVGNTIIPNNIEDKVAEAIAKTKHDVTDDELESNEATMTPE